MIGGGGIRGTIATVKWAYFTAAAVNGYAVTRDRDTKEWTVTGAFVPGLVDAYKIAQRPIFFVAPFRHGAWRWEIHKLDILEGGRFVARLGAMSMDGANGLTSTPTGN
jgi:hypothetical protein